MESVQDNSEQLQTLFKEFEELEKEVMPQLKFYPDFPKKGVNFLDVFSATTNPDIFRKLMEAFKKLAEVKYGKPGEAFTHIVGIDSKGFVLGPILALQWNLPFVAVRKKGKLPGECWTQSYTLEYGSDTLEIQKDAFPAGSKAILIDDLLATGGTLRATEDLIANIPDSEVVGSLCIWEIDLLKGREKLTRPFEACIHLREIL